MDYSVSEDVLKRHGTVFSLVAGGARIWVKKRRRRDNPGFLHLQRLTYFLTRITLLVPPGAPPADSVAFETDRLRRAAELGIRVPAVLHRTENYFVLEDAGESLLRRLKNRPEEAEELVGRVAAELRRLHDLGIVHGGTQIKNIAVRDGEIYFIDFEENIPPGRPELFRLRDLFLFIFSLEKNGFDPDLRRVCEGYGRGDAEEVLKRLLPALRQLRVLGIFKSRLFAAMPLRDIRVLCALADKAASELKHERTSCS